MAKRKSKNREKFALKNSESNIAKSAVEQEDLIVDFWGTVFNRAEFPNASDTLTAELATVQCCLIYHGILNGI